MMALIAAAALTACRETEVPLQPEPEPPTPPGDTSRVVTRFSPVVCNVNVSEGTTECGTPSNVASSDLVVGGQGRYIDITNTSNAYNVNTHLYSMTVYVRNLIGQAMGTENGVSLDPRGVRLFVANGPTLTGGTGEVTFANPEGFGNYTGGQQPYRQYDAVLDPFEQSPPEIFQFSMPATVTNFTFTLYVATAVRYPDGWIEVTPSPFPIAPFEQWQMTAIHHDVLGDVIPGEPVVWSIVPADTVTASLAADGTVKAKRAGSIVITATTPSRSGTATLLVHGITRVWDGSSDTNWDNKSNWVGNIVPVTADSVLIPVAAPLDPSLVSNVQVDGVTVEDVATLNINAFNLTATGNVTTGLSGGITNTSGQVILAGVAKTVQGVLPRVRVTGTYSLTANLTTRAPVQVDAGRLTVSAFRLQSSSF